jgi:membrane associated rhomboid family serine protease
MEEVGWITRYLTAASPLLLAQLMIPPLSYFVGERVDSPFLDILYESLGEAAPKFFRLKYLCSLLCNPHDLKGDKVMTMFSYMFVHVNYQHLFYNLQNLMIDGLPIYREFGAIGMYAVFFGSGIVATLPSPFHTSLPSSQSFSPLQFWRSPQFLCGSSGGIFGLFAGGALCTFYNHLSSVKDRLDGRPCSSLIIKDAISFAQLIGVVVSLKAKVEIIQEGIGNITPGGHTQAAFAGIFITVCLHLWRASFWKRKSPSLTRNNRSSRK